MNILYLKYAVEVAKTGSINKAAENLFMAQPNLSRAIKDLENSLGVTIFDRNSKGMSVTPHGEKLLLHAERLLKQVDELESLFSAEINKTLQFSISVPRASYISRAFTRFSLQLNSAERSKVYYSETNSMRAIDNILHSDYNLGIIRYAYYHDKYFSDTLTQKGLVGELVNEFKYSLIMSKDHPLAGKGKVSFSDLTDYIEIAHADPYVPSLALSEIYKSELPDTIARRIFVFERASQFELLNENTRTFMWVSPPPKEILERYNLVVKKCDDNNKLYRDVLICKKDYKLSDFDKIFIAELSRAKRESEQQN